MLGLMLISFRLETVHIYFVCNKLINYAVYTTAIIVIIIAIIYLSITLISKYFCVCNKPINYAVYNVFY